MSHALKFYKLTIRNAADSADEVVITSFSGGGLQPFICGEPTGDGQSFDFMSGQYRSGSFNVPVADNGGSANPITQRVFDAGGRPAMLLRRANLKVSYDSGGTFPEWVDGWITQLTLVSPARFDVMVNSSSGIETRRRLFVQSSDPYGQPTNIIGTPVTGGFVQLRDSGPQYAKVTIQETWGTRLDLDIKSFINVSLAMEYAITNTSQYVNGWGGIRDRINQITRGKFVPWLDPGPWSAHIQGYFPTLLAEVWNEKGTTHYGTFNVLASPVSSGGPAQNEFIDLNARFYVSWNATDPSHDGERVRVRVYEQYISESNPFHIVAHPVDLLAQICAVNGMPYSASSFAAEKARIGPNIRLALRITGPVGLKAFVEGTILAPFGMGWGKGAGGEWSLFRTTITTSDSPSFTINTTKSVSLNTQVWSVTEGNIINVVTVRTLLFAVYDPNSGGEVPPDCLIPSQNVRQVDLGDDNLDQYGQHEFQVDIQGFVWQTDGGALDTSEAIAKPYLTRYGNGAPMSEVLCDSSVLSSILIGDLVKENLPQAPVGNSRGGAHLFQVAKISPRREGVLVSMIDAGADVQPATGPTFTLDQESDNPINRAVATITNLATLAAQAAAAHTRGVVVVQVAQQVSEPDPDAGGFAVASVDVATGPAAVPLGPYSAGSILWVRMRCEEVGKLPSDWSAWQSVELDSISPPESLSVTAESTDPSLRLVTFAQAGDGSSSRCLVHAWVLASDGAVSDADLMAQGQHYTMPIGSLQVLFLGLDAGPTYQWGVRFEEQRPLAGFSDLVQGDEFVQESAINTLLVPTSVVVFVGFPGANGTTVVNGFWSVGFYAPSVPGESEIRVAIGSGSPEVVGRVQNVGGSLTIWRSAYAVPNDGQLRYVSVRSVGPGYSPSGYTDPIAIDVWGVSSPPPPWPPSVLPAFSMADLDAPIGDSNVNVTWTVVNQPAGSYVEVVYFDTEDDPDPGTNYGAQTSPFTIVTPYTFSTKVSHHGIEITVTLNLRDIGTDALYTSTQIVRDLWITP